MAQDGPKTIQNDGVFAADGTLLNPGYPINGIPSRRYKKKPVEIEAFRLGLNLANTPAWLKSVVWTTRDPGGNTRVERVEIATLEGTMTAHPGDWIIKGVEGELYPCKHEIFKKTYEEA